MQEEYCCHRDPRGIKVNALRGRTPTVSTRFAGQATLLAHSQGVPLQGEAGGGRVDTEYS
jgi:hypothetical protein